MSEAPAELLEGLARRGPVIPVGVRVITRSASDRYCIWLPTQLNSVWSILWSRRAKVNVLLVVEGEQGKGEAWG